MGSIYHFGPTNFGAVSWAQLLEDTRKIFEAARDNSPDKIFGASGKQSTELRGPSGEDDEPTIDERSIAFNGYGDHSGEPFILYKKGRADWCKTRDEEYYWVVALVLIRAHKHGDIKVGCNDELDGAGWPFVKEMHLKLWPDEVWKNPFIEEEVESAGGEDLNVADHKGLAVRDKKN